MKDHMMRQLSRDVDAASKDPLRAFLLVASITVVSGLTLALMVWYI